MSRTLFIAYSGTYNVAARVGHKLGDSITESYTARLFCEAKPYTKILLSLNPKHHLNFCFDQVIKDYNIEVLWDDWPENDQPYIYRRCDARRQTRKAHGQTFDDYRELYLRVDGGPRQIALAGSEVGLGRRGIFDYLYFGQEEVPTECPRGADFRPSAFGWTWDPRAPQKSVFVSPHAVSQTNDVFTLDFWHLMIQELVRREIQVEVNTPEKGRFGEHPRLTYFFQHDHDLKALFKHISHQRLSLSGNTGTFWCSAAHGVPVMVGEPIGFMFADYRARQNGVPAINIFDSPNVHHIANAVQHFLVP